MKHDMPACNDADHSVNAIKQLYLETVDELHRFAQMTPSGTVDEAEMEAAEEALLAYESHLLTQASKTPLRSNEDVTALMDIWASVIGAEDTDERGRQSDKIAMNLFRHLLAE